MFLRKPQMLSIPENERIVLIAGGGGEFGKTVIDHKPAHTFIANISRRSVLETDNAVTFHFDLVKEPERAFRHIANILPRVDVFVYAVYSNEFAAVDRIARSVFLHEYETNVYAAIECARLCGKYFWEESVDRNRARRRKVMFISSAAAFGKTPRPELASYSATKAALNAIGPYAHDYFFKRYGSAVAILAPGSLRESATREKFIKKFWETERAPLERFVLEKIV